MFDKIEGDISLLDPGCGSGSLTAAFVDEAIRRKKVSSLNLHAFDIDSVVQPFIKETLSLCAEKSQQDGISVKTHFTLDDFILSQTNNSELFKRENGGEWQFSKSHQVAHYKNGEYTSACDSAEIEGLCHQTQPNLETIAMSSS